MVVALLFCGVFVSHLVGFDMVQVLSLKFIIKAYSQGFSGSGLCLVYLLMHVLSKSLFFVDIFQLQTELLTC